MSATLPSGTEIVIVSPHRDDAAFSCGIIMHKALQAQSVRVINIFTRSAYAPFAPEVERQGTAAVTEVRRQEDANLMHFLSSQIPAKAHMDETSLDLLDAPLRLRLQTEDVQGQPLREVDFEREVASLSALLRPFLQHAASVLLPLGIGGSGLEGHIDHRIAREAGRRCAEYDRTAFYEDLPYAARVRPEELTEAVTAFVAGTPDVKPITVAAADAGRVKHELASFYASQIDAATMREMAIYTAEHGGERIYAASSARGVLESV